MIMNMVCAQNLCTFCWTLLDPTYAFPENSIIIYILSLTNKQYYYKIAVLSSLNEHKIP